MNNAAIQKALQIIQEAQSILVVSHLRPDGDAIGSVLGLSLALQSAGKDVQMILEDGGPGGGAVFICEKGKIRIDRGQFQVEPEELARQLVPDPAVMRGGAENHMQNWIDCIKTRERPVADVEIGHRSTTVCHLGNIARWLGRRLQWDPQNEQFIGDEEANQLLERPQRAGYQIPEVI